jgi:hypothetical protein
MMGGGPLPWSIRTDRDDLAGFWAGVAERGVAELPSPSLHPLALHVELELAGSPGADRVGVCANGEAEAEAEDGRVGVGVDGDGDGDGDQANEDVADELAANRDIVREAIAARS